MLCITLTVAACKQEQSDTTQVQPEPNPPAQQPAGTTTEPADTTTGVETPINLPTDAPQNMPSDTPQIVSGITPHIPNHRYWEYKGKPVLLIGGSKEDNLFQIPDLEQHLDLLAAVGGNYARNTMSSRDPGNLHPFQQRPDGKFDLNQLNEKYFERFEQFLQLTSARDIIVQIELWDRFDFALEHWLINAFRPANNINYTPEESGLANEYPRHPNNNDNPFFRSIPDHDNNKLLLKYQHAFMDRLIGIALKYPNVLYTMDNETNATPQWGAYWSNYIQRKAAAAGKKIFTTEMWDPWNLKDEKHRETLDYPELYAFVEISQNTHNFDQEHWDQLQWVLDYTSRTPRPLNQVKIYGADTGPYGSDNDGLERFWRGIIGGSAGVRFHRPTSGLGLNEVAQASLRSAKLLQADFDIFRAVPDSESKLLLERSPDEAYLAYIPTMQYAVYFTNGGSVQLDMTTVPGNFQLKWLDIGNSAWQTASNVTGNTLVTLEAPGPGHWVALLVKTQASPKDASGGASNK